jgi:hypothetical protein
MISDSRQLNYFRRIAELLYVPMVIEDYGSDKQDLLIHLTNSISEIYKHLKFNEFDSVTIYVSIDDGSSLSSVSGTSPNTIKSYESLSQISGNEIVIEVKKDGELNYLIDFEFEIEAARGNSIIYKHIKSTETETIFGKTSERILLPIPDASSYFAIQTYKDLELALEDYGTKIARYSECVYLQSAWLDISNKIFFKPKPEHILRDSLTQFLKMRLRNVEVRPEQIVDKSHPVDIKITWSLANHLALLEIKWLGKSLEKIGKGFTKICTPQRALDGAKQLADYLDANTKQASVKTTKGYLVIFDARRWGCNNTTTSIDAKNGLHYVNNEIVFDPDYHSQRTDFAKPLRFFLEPVISI